MTVQGTAFTAATSVAMPTHQAGDLILVFTKRNNDIPPSVPAAGGTVPAWTAAHSGGLNGLSLVTAWALATAANHTTGVWTNTAHICVLVLRPAGGKTLGFAGIANNDAAATQTIVYPALTLSTTAGTSWGVRCGTRVTVDSEVANAPAGWTNQIAQPAGSTSVAVHTRAGLASNPASDSVTTAGTNATYRAHTMEVTESAASTQQPMAMVI